MNFDFDDDQKLLQDQARRFLAERSPRAAARRVLDGGDPIDRDLWRGIAELGWPGIAVPENLGGTGMGYEGLCLLADGRLAVADRSGTVRLHAVADGKRLRTIPTGGGAATSLAVSADGRLLAVGSLDGSISLFRLDADAAEPLRWLAAP